MTTHEINIDLDKTCTVCGGKGASESGICLDCAAEFVKDDYEVKFRGDWAEASPTVVNMAKALIAKHHPHLHNFGARIGFLFRKEAPIKNGRQTLGKTQKVTERLQVMLDYDFLVWVAKDVWDNLTTARRMALLDHELTHCMMGQNGWAIRPHDVEEFVEVVARWGFWDRDLMKIQELATMQPELPGMDRAGKVEAVNLANVELEGELS